MKYIKYVVALGIVGITLYASQEEHGLIAFSHCTYRNPVPPYGSSLSMPKLGTWGELDKPHFACKTKLGIGIDNSTDTCAFLGLSSDNKVISVASLLLVKGFGFGQDVQEIQKFQALCTTLLALRRPVGVELYTIKQVPKTGISATLQYSKELATSTLAVLASAASALKEVAQSRTLSWNSTTSSEIASDVFDSNFDVEMQPVKGGAISVLKDTVAMTWYDGSLVILHKPAPTFDESHSTILRKANICNEQCQSNPLSRQYDKKLQEYVSLDTLTTLMAKDKLLFFGGENKDKEPSVIGLNEEQEPVVVIKRDADLADKLSSHSLFTGLVALLHYENIQNDAINILMKEVCNNTDNILGVTPEYVVAETSKNFIARFRYNHEKQKWQQGQYILFNRESAPNQEEPEKKFGETYGKKQVMYYPNCIVVTSKEGTSTYYPMSEAFIESQDFSFSSGLQVVRDDSFNDDLEKELSEAALEEDAWIDSTNKEDDKEEPTVFSAASSTSSQASEAPVPSDTTYKNPVSPLLVPVEEAIGNETFPVGSSSLNTEASAGDEGNTGDIHEDQFTQGSREAEKDLINPTTPSESDTILAPPAPPQESTQKAETSKKKKEKKPVGTN